MKLFLLRHAEAENTRPDADRRLTQNGRQSIDDLAAFLKPRQLKLDIDAIWHSPLARARETAERFQRGCGLEAPLIPTDGLRPLDDPEAVARRLRYEHPNLLLVGHNPHFETLAALLLGLDPGRVPLNIPKAAFLRFRRDGHGEDARWQLRDLLTPKLSADVPNTDL